VRRQAALLLLLAIAAGCGGHASKRLTKAQYERLLQTEGRMTFRAAAHIDLRHRAAAAKIIAREQKALAKAADDLSHARPPANVVHDNDLLARGLGAAADEYVRLQHDLESGKQVNLVRVFVEVSQTKALVDARRAIDDLKRKGYSIGPFGGE